MVTGDITLTVLGPYDADDHSGAMKIALDALSTGAATAGADTTSYQIIYIGEGQVMVYQIVRAA